MLRSPPTHKLVKDKTSQPFEATEEVVLHRYFDGEKEERFEGHHRQVGSDHLPPDRRLVRVDPEVFEQLGLDLVGDEL